MLTPIIQPIVALGSPILREVCRPADNTDADGQVLLDLIATRGSLKTCQGLAAPQINANIQAFVLKDPVQDIVVVNPTIVKRRMKQRYNEGCMSIPDIYADVEDRDDIIDVEFYDINFNKVRKRFRGFMSIVFQHEYDHLQGILFIDRLSKSGMEAIREKLAAIENQKVTAYYPIHWPGAQNPVEIKTEVNE